MNYSLMRQLLFRFPAETAHNITMNALKMGNVTGLLPLFMPKMYAGPVELMGLDFPNRIGLAAGLDKNGDYIDAMATFGFGFLEVGTVTPRPQPGNPKPRMFRIIDKEAIINRMGFNNFGVDYMVQQLRKKKFEGVIGINVGKNKDTPAEQSGNDYVACIEKVYSLASYITINISSPNTPGLRALQFGEFLPSMLKQIKDCQERLRQEQRRYVPLVVKIAPDMADDEISLLAKTVLEHEMDGVIATNTTISREGVEDAENGKQQGGLSGRPLTQRSTQVVNVLAKALEQKIPVIASGGVMSGQDAVAKIEAGASLVQIYSGLIYKGPQLIKEAAEAVDEKFKMRAGGNTQ